MDSKKIGVSAFWGHQDLRGRSQSYRAFSDEPRGHGSGPCVRQAPPPSHLWGSHHCLPVERWSLSLDTVHFSPSSPCHPCWDTFFVFTICFWPQPFLDFSPLESVDSAVCFYQLCPLPPYTSNSLLLSAQIVTRKSRPQSRGGDSVPSSGGPLPSAKACHLPIICCYTVSLPVLNGVV